MTHTVFPKFSHRFPVSPALCFAVVMFGLLMAAAVFSPKIRTPAAGPPERDPCRAVSNQYHCYADRARKIAAADGFQAAFQYVNSAGREFGYHNVLHMAMHEVGRAAYRETQNLDKALQYFFNSLDPHYFDFALEGYRHGVFQGFFASQKNSQSMDALIQRACGMHMPTATARDPYSPREDVAKQCFHGVGHALMYTYGNDVFRSLAPCDRLPAPWMQNWCYYGIFMENSYLYSSLPPFYEPGKPKPFAAGPGMTQLCGEVSRRQRPACARFVARSVFMGAFPQQLEEFQRGFDQCRRVDVDEYYRQLCVRDAAVLFIPPPFKSDPEKMFGICERAGSYKGSCIEGVAAGISLGAAGFSNRDRPVCDAAGEQFRVRCRAVIEQKEHVKDFRE